MRADRRTEAARAFWSDEDMAEPQAEAVLLIAKQKHFRPRSAASLPIDRKARYLATMTNLPDALALRALVAYHLQAQRPMMARFLDALGIAHENGLITAENVPPPSREALARAAAELASAHDSEDVAVYLSTLLWQDPETWGHLEGLPELREP